MFTFYLLIIYQAYNYQQPVNNEYNKFSIIDFFNITINNTTKDNGTSYENKTKYDNKTSEEGDIIMKDKFEGTYYDNGNYKNGTLTYLD